uniref:glycosyltransferase n=1 Tax=uncultured Methanomethylovorans sp. TaxID=183759 RepID=UPI0026100BAC
MTSDTITFFLSIVGMILTFQTIVLIAFSYLHYSTKKYELTNYSPLVSVIVPCYNEALTLKNCVTSILSQTYKNYE